MDEAFYSISWANKMAGFPNPCESDLALSVREGCHKTIGHDVINKNEQVTSNILEQLCCLHSGLSYSL